MIDAATESPAVRERYWTDQLNNDDSIPGYHQMGEEIWDQTGGQVTGFVQSVGTGASLRGVASALWKHDPTVRMIAVEPAEYAVLSGGQSAAYSIEGIGIGYTPSLSEPDVSR